MKKLLLASLLLLSNNTVIAKEYETKFNLFFYNNLNSNNKYQCVSFNKPKEITMNIDFNDINTLKIKFFIYVLSCPTEEDILI
jgi:hypothetical protein